MENEAALQCVTMRERARVSTYSYNFVYNFLIFLLLLKSSVFVAHFLNVFWHGNESFSKGSSQNEVVRLLVIFHLPYSKCRGVKNVFTQVIIKIKIFHSRYTRVFHVAVMLHLCCSCSTRVTRVSLALHSCHLCCTRVLFVSLVSHSCYLCCKLNYIQNLLL